MVKAQVDDEAQGVYEFQFGVMTQLEDEVLVIKKNTESQQRSGPSDLVCLSQEFVVHQKSVRMTGESVDLK